VYLVAGVAVCAAYMALPESALSAVLYVSVAASSAVAMLVGVRRYRPARPLPWVLLAVGLTGFTGGEAITYWSALALGVELGVPSVADVAYLSMYLLVGTGLAILARRRTPGGDRAALLDASIISVAVALLSWVFLISPTLGSSGMATDVRAASVAYPIGDLVLIAVVARLWSDRGPRGASFGLLGFGLVPLLAADTGYTWLVLNGNYSTGSFLDAGWLVFFLALGAAALHPSMRNLDASAAPAHQRISGGRFALLLALASLLVPALIAIRVAGGDPVDLPVLGSVSAILFVLVLLRMADLVRALREMHRERSEGRFQRLTEHVTDVITICDAAGAIRYQTPSVERLLGWTVPELHARSIMEIVHPEDVDRIAAMIGSTAGSGRIGPVECRLRHRDGTWLTTETLGRSVDDDELRGFLLTTRDTTERRALEDQLTHKAFHDDLTGLANRALLADRVQHALERRTQSFQHLAVVVVDIDDFKTINDSLGRMFGDDLLRAVAERLRGCLRSSDTAARLGGDEFAMLLDDLDDAAEAAHVAQRVLDALREPYLLQGREVVVRASLGIALADPDRLPDADDLLSSADVAMHTAKRQGRNRYAYFAPSMHAGLVSKLDLIDDLRRGLDRNELLVHYQPLVELATGRMVAAESLVRWQHPTRGMVLPDEFIPVAEETGLVVPLGYAVLNQACHEAAAWQSPDSPPISVTVNLSPRQVQDPALVEHVRAALAGSGLAPARLMLEITESLLSEDEEIAAIRLRALKDLGVRLAVDDFGTGYSSLTRLHEYPIDTVKIPKPFVDNVAGDGSALARAILDMSFALGLSVVAEGIERVEQAEALQRMGCQIGQGYLFAKPVPGNELRALLGRSDLRPVMTGRALSPG
jgi:diguanylate cyclase (GGDEF)-like protein/PAS domain S-box-containing protein